MKSASLLWRGLGPGVLAVLLAGCNPPASSDDGGPGDTRLATLEGKVEAVERRAAQAAMAERVAADMEILRWQVEALTGRVARLESELAAAKRETSDLTSAAARRLTAAEERLDRTGARIDLLELKAARIVDPNIGPKVTSSGPAVSTAGINEQEWAVRVFDVRGDKVVIGKHTARRMVETDEEYRDSFGQIRKRLKPEEYEVEQYDYRAFFSIENLSPRPRQVSARAGAGPTNFLLGAKAMVTNVVVHSVVGSNLNLEIDEKARSFRVSYPSL
jgi:hypothetical protein